MGTRPPRVAILDDDAESAALMEVLLGEEGYRADRPRLSSVADLAELVADGGYDLVVLDLDGVVGDDVGAIERLRGDPRLDGVPILVCSTDIQVLRDNAAALSSLPDVVALEKPFRIEVLAGVLRRLLDGVAVLASAAPAQPSPEALAEVEAWLAELGQAIRWAALDAWIPDVRPGLLRCAAAWTAAERFEPFARISRRMHLPYGGGLPGRVWVSGAASWIEDLSRDLNFPRQTAARHAGLVSAAAAPVVDGGTTIGVVAAYTTMRRARDAAVVDELLAASADATPLFRSFVSAPASS